MSLTLYSVPEPDRYTRHHAAAAPPFPHITVRHRLIAAGKINRSHLAARGIMKQPAVINLVAAGKQLIILRRCRLPRIVLPQVRLDDHIAGLPGAPRSASRLRQKLGTSAPRCGNPAYLKEKSAARIQPRSLPENHALLQSSACRSGYLPHDLQMPQNRFMSAFFAVAIASIRRIPRQSGKIEILHKFFHLLRSQAPNPAIYGNPQDGRCLHQRNRIAAVMTDRDGSSRVVSGNITMRTGHSLPRNNRKQNWNSRAAAHKKHGLLATCESLCRHLNPTFQ